MKKVIFPAIVTFLAFTFISCKSTSSKEKIGENVAVVATEVKKVDPFEVPEIKPGHKVLSPEEEGLLLNKIASLTKPEDAYRIWLDNDGKVSVEAYKKYKALGGKD